MDPEHASDPVLPCHRRHVLLLYIEGNPGHTKILGPERFRAYPKPLILPSQFLFSRRHGRLQAISRIAAEQRVYPPTTCRLGLRAAPALSPADLRGESRPPSLNHGYRGVRMEDVSRRQDL